MPRAATIIESTPAAPGGSSVGLRKPPGVAGEVARSENTRTVFRSKSGRPALGQKVAEVVESTVLFWGVTRDPEVRAKVRAQVCRLRRDKKRRYDPRLAGRIIAKRLHIPEIAVAEILQGTIPEFEEWKSWIARAEAAAAAVWQRRSA